MLTAGFFGFDEEEGGAADAKGVVGGFGGTVDFDGNFVDDLAEAFGGPGTVGNVPAEGFEEGVKEIAAELGFVVFAGLVGGALFGEALN